MHDPRNSWAVAAKIKDNESSVVPAVVMVVMKSGLKKATGCQPFSLIHHAEECTKGERIAPIFGHTSKSKSIKRINGLP